MKSMPPVPLQTPPAMVFIEHLLVGGVILSCIASFFLFYLIFLNFSFMKDEAAPPTRERCRILSAAGARLRSLPQGAALQGAGEDFSGDG